MQIALIQITSSLDPKENLEKVDYFIKLAKKKDEVQAVFLPEVFYSMSDGLRATPYLVEKENEHYKNIQKLSYSNQVALIGGSAATLNNSKVINRTYNFDSKGNELDQYDKMHLFAVDLSDTDKNVTINESVVYTEGSRPALIDYMGWKIGLGICFDLRFPEFFRYYFQKGAELLTVSSAFTQSTGLAHWETLVRARAIENQAFVVAVNQWGEHNKKIKTFGHSMLVDPWGEVLINMGQGEGYAVSNLSKEKINTIRKRMDVRLRKYINYNFK